MYHQHNGDMTYICVCVCMYMYLCVCFANRAWVKHQCSSTVVVVLVVSA